jgi:hypothetical protein
LRNLSQSYNIPQSIRFHAEQIKKKLGISGILTRQYAWRSRSGGTEEGAQIDLLIERSDDAVNICEMKYSSSEYEIGKDENDQNLMTSTLDRQARTVARQYRVLRLLGQPLAERETSWRREIRNHLVRRRHLLPRR